MATRPVRHLLGTRQKTPYNASFFGITAPGARRSAESIVPIVLSLVPARSVVDVGCGDGTWLATFTEQGVEDIVGVDGAYMRPESLRIPAERFVAHDLATPLVLDRTFDLVVSLEVAEHLPPQTAPTFVASLTRLGPVVLFAAAAPFQGGTGHVNEQWPAYWAEFFASHGYAAVDCIRPRVWNDGGVDFWYAQNTLLYVHEGHLATHPELGAAGPVTREPLALVHPNVYLRRSAPRHPHLEALSAELRRAARGARRLAARAGRRGRAWRRLRRRA